MIDKNIFNLLLLAIVFSLHGGVIVKLEAMDKLYTIGHFFMIAAAFFIFIFVYNEYRKQIELAKLQG